MAFFDKLGEKISKSGQDAAQKAKNLAETVKLKGYVSDEEKRITNTHFVIGKLYYESFAESPDPIFTQHIADINDAKAKIQKYTEQIKQIKGVTSCEKCNAEVLYTAPFCSSCGNKMPAPPQPEGNICVKCHAHLAENQVFCTGCGTRVEKSPSIEAYAPPVLPKCSNCGYDIGDDVLFCLNCGTKVGTYSERH